LLDAAEQFNIDLGASFMVGDRASDIEAGRAAGCRTVFIDLGYTAVAPDNPTFRARSLREATDLVLQAERGSS
jgi:D-glycero-D-manno-heptose 1,7-bisphosphate phosphatase